MKFIYISKYLITTLMVVTFFIVGCKPNKNIPDVSSIKIDLSTERFEKDFFNLDTLHLDSSIQKLFDKYPDFSVNYLHNILAAAPHADSVINTILHFTKDYKKLYNDAENLFADFSPYEKEIKQGFQFVKYYFPNYTLPTKLVTYIGTWDAIIMLSDNSGGSGCIRMSEDVLGIGLQLSMGTNYAMYKDEMMQQFYPEFISRRFDKAFIGVNALKVIVDDIYPMQNKSYTLIEQMIEAGKRLYVLNAFMPTTPDSLKTGYTQQQLEGCYKNEANIWSFFITNSLLYETQPSIVMEYMNDAPRTAALGDAAPGLIGKFVGWQIVKKWMEKNNKKPWQDLLSTAPKNIFEQAKYKP
ncbi:MAG TPA: hypothetical protein PKG56_02845 [Chitinophagaceae bacterium]|nr:hypothetical protein [Chitinophagaceae bacterium]